MREFVKKWGRQINIAICLIMGYSVIDLLFQAHYAYTELTLAVEGWHLQIALVNDHIHFRRRPMVANDWLGLNRTRQWNPQAAFVQEKLPPGQPEFAYPQWINALLLIIGTVDYVARNRIQAGFSRRLAKPFTPEEELVRRSIARINGRMIEIMGLVMVGVFVWFLCQKLPLPMNFLLIGFGVGLAAWWIGRCWRIWGQQKPLEYDSTTSEELVDNLGVNR